jgi:hypothetical protein
MPTAISRFSSSGLCRNHAERTQSRVDHIVVDNHRDEAPRPNGPQLRNRRAVACYDYANQASRSLNLRDRRSRDIQQAAASGCEGRVNRMLAP